MCGVNGIFSFRASAPLPNHRELIATRDAMESRGPDGAGEWWSGDRRLALGHRRLSILDLDIRASQPMVSQCGRFAVTFNGEIYNYPALRKNLEAKGVTFRTSSDTEVLLHLFALKDVHMVHDLRGMFAFGLWDNQTRRLFLARDPYGIKPLYTSNEDGVFRFSSQVKALLAGKAVSSDIDPAGAVGFHIWGSVPEPFTFYKSISALPAGCTQIVDENGPHEPRAYENIAAIFSDGAAKPASADGAEQLVRDAMRESVAAHLLADVEVGVFLSAGVDSGSLLGLMRDAGQSEIRAITIAFEEFAGTPADEAPIAADIARYYGAKHTIRTISQAEFEADLPKILDAMDQPTIDGINVWFVSKAAKEAGLKVALSGLGGDELFGGYFATFQQIPRMVSLLRVPSALPGAGLAGRAVIECLGLNKSNPKLLGLLQYGGSYEGAYLLRRGLFLPFELDSFLTPDTVEAGLMRLQPFSILKNSMTPLPSHPLSRVAALESSNYMRMQLLRDTDWAGMAHSLEIRTPYVDIELLRSLACVTPRATKGMGKRLLAKSPSSPMPDEIVDRKKTGFGVPIGRWLAKAMRYEPQTAGLASRHWARTLYAKAVA